MATGTGKTRTASSLTDVLSRGKHITNILFLADRTALVKQARDDFKKYLPSMSLCNLCTNKDDRNARIVFSTYPTMLNAIDTEKTKSGIPLFTPAHFDLIIIDESHRSIFKKYRAIFEYFDAILVGLTATPKMDVDRNTYDFFEMEHGVPTYAYDYETAVHKDHVLVPYYNYEVGTQFLEEGITYDKLSDADVPVGSAVLNVASAQVDDAEKSALAQAAAARGAYQVSDVFDMSLDQVVYKGTNSPEGAWTASLGSESPLKDPAQVSLQLGGVYANDVIVMHEEHDGSVTVVDSNYDAATNAVSFDAPGFSDYAIAIVPQKAAEVYRLYNPNSGEHFYTTNKGEYDAVQAAGWTGEGAAWHALAEGNRPVYRLYNPYGGEHHYTMSAHERDTLVQLGWTDEKVAFYAGDDTGTPVHRLYNPNKFSCNHLFTTDENEYKTVKGYGWNDEGIAWFAVPTGA